MTDSRRSFLSAIAVTGLAAPMIPTPEETPPDAAAEVSVARFGAVGDGATPSAEAFQAAIDAVEAAGGGMVSVPAGTFVLERTPLIASRVHLRGAGAATVLRGSRPDDARGAALISNKGQQAAGYEGAHDWAISHLTIDSPDTNGIVVTHARNVYISHIYGVQTYNHFIDTAGQNILCEHLFLTGRSGTSSFQVDSLSGAQTIWDGRQAVAPRYDDTDTENLILRQSIITAAAGHEGTRDHHHVSVHFHGDDARTFLFSDLILGGAEFGFYQDADTRYQDIHIASVVSRNPGHAAWFGPGPAGQRGLRITGLTHEPAAPAPDGRTPGRQRSIYVHGRRDVQLAGLRIVHDDVRETDYAVRAEASESVLISHSILEGRGGAGLAAEGSRGSTLVTGCLFNGFETGIRERAPADGAELVQQANVFLNTAEEVSRGA